MEKKRKRHTEREIIFGVLIALDKLEIDTPLGVAKEIGCDPRTVRRAVREFHEALGLVIVRMVSRGKKQIEVYKISEAYSPIWEEVKDRIKAMVS